VARLATAKTTTVLQGHKQSGLVELVELAVVTYFAGRLSRFYGQPDKRALVDQRRLNVSAFATSACLVFPK